MGRIALVFPGQGSQAVGMGAELAAAYPAAAQVFERTCEALGRDLPGLCHRGPAGTLDLTQHAQPALYAVSMAAMAVLEEKDVDAEVVCGHSLGEYSALAAAGVVDFETGLLLMARRGEIMARAAEKRPGAMAAVLGLDDAQVEEICAGAGEVWPVNYNSPGQLVVSGETAAVEQAMRAAVEAGARKVVRLAVSGAFHTPLMADAAAELQEFLAGVEMREPETAFVSSITCEYASAAGLKELLVRQMVSPVRWAQTVQRLIGEGFDTYVEVGSGKVLAGLIKRIAKDAGNEVQILSAADPAGIDKTLAALADSGA